MCEGGNIADHVDELKAQKEELEKEEKELDEQSERLRVCLKNITEDTYNDQYPLSNVCWLPHSLTPSGVVYIPGVHRIYIILICIVWSISRHLMLLVLNCFFFIRSIYILTTARVQHKF